ncbi:hypothetical protein PG984_008419 [Apiospora sp. TS-2023a]
MLIRLACLSFLALATAAPANNAHKLPDNSHARATAATCSGRPATAPELTVRNLAYRASEDPPGFGGLPMIYSFSITLQVTNPANATEWTCSQSVNSPYPEKPPQAIDDNITDPHAVLDGCYSREDPDLETPWHPPRPRRATWFSFDIEKRTVVVGQRVTCVDDDGHAYVDRLLAIGAGY